MFAVLALLAAAPACPFQVEQAGAACSEDPGLVLHLTGDISRDREQVEEAGLDLRGFKQRFGPEGWSMSVSPSLEDVPTTASLVGFELGPTSSLEFLVRPRGRSLSVLFDDHGLRMASLVPVAGPHRPTRFEHSLDPPNETASHVELTIEPTAFGYGVSTWTEAETKLPADRWTHVAFVRDRATTGTVRLVIDGVATARQLGASPEDARRDAGKSWPTSRLDVQLSGVGVGLDLADLRIHDRFVSTAELSGRRRAGLGTADSPPVLLEPCLESPESWAAGAFERVVPETAGAAWVPAHWTQDHPASGPHARTCHAVVSAGPGRLLVFGGELRDTHAGRMANGDDVWLYHLDEQRWERVAGGATGRTSTELRAAYAASIRAKPPEQQPAGSRLHSAGPRVLPDFELTHGPAPGPRCHQGMAFDPATGQALLLGGWFNAPGGGFQYGDVWLFDVATGRWTEHVQDGPVPAVGDQQPIFHAGLGRFLFLTRHAVWSVDPSDGSVRREPNPSYLDEQLQPIEARTTAQAMTWYDPDLELAVRFGGFWITPPSEPGAQPIKQRTSDLLVYSHEHAAWVLRETPNAAPSPRVRGAVAYDTRRDRAVLFGGITGGLDDRTSDLWTYAAKTNTWTELRASNAPGPRGGYFGMAYDEERDVFVLPFGRQDTDVFLDEVWRLRFDDEAWGSATWRFDREGWQPGLEAAVEWLGPEGAVDELEPRVLLRGSDDGEVFGAWGSDAGSERFVELRVELAPGMRLTSVGFE